MLRILELGIAWIIATVVLGRIIWPLCRGWRTTQAKEELNEVKDDLEAARIEENILQIHEKAVAIRRKGEKSDSAEDHCGCGRGGSVDCGAHDDGKHV